MKLSRARVCMDCDEVYEAAGECRCPKCGGAGANLALWLERKPVNHLAHISYPSTHHIPETANSGAVGRPL